MITTVHNKVAGNVPATKPNLGLSQSNEQDTLQTKIQDLETQQQEFAEKIVRKTENLAHGAQKNVDSSQQLVDGCGIIDRISGNQSAIETQLGADKLYAKNTLEHHKQAQSILDPAGISKRLGVSLASGAASKLIGNVLGAEASESIRTKVAEHAGEMTGNITSQVANGELNGQNLATGLLGTVASGNVLKRSKQTQSRSQITSDIVEDIKDNDSPDPALSINVEPQENVLIVNEQEVSTENPSKFSKISKSPDPQTELALKERLAQLHEQFMNDKPGFDCGECADSLRSLCSEEAIKSNQVNRVMFHTVGPDGKKTEIYLPQANGMKEAYDYHYAFVYRGMVYDPFISASPIPHNEYISSLASHKREMDPNSRLQVTSARRDMTTDQFANFRLRESRSRH